MKTLPANKRLKMSHLGNMIYLGNTTTIFFKNLTDQDIWDYVATQEPLDKAGAYGIQGLGGALVEKYEGLFDNVVGLPVASLKELLNQFTFSEKS